MMGDSVENGPLVMDLAFPYRLLGAGGSRRECLFLLHGSGVDETTLVPLARQIAPDAVLIAARGRIPPGGRFSLVRADHPDAIRTEKHRCRNCRFRGIRRRSGQAPWA